MTIACLQNPFPVAHAVPDLDFTFDSGILDLEGYFLFSPTFGFSFFSFCAPFSTEFCC
jgi:hypothetical protein